MFPWSRQSAPPRARQNIVLDLDECLVHTVADPLEMPDHVRDAPELKPYLYTVDTEQGVFWGVKRPHVDEFLAFVGAHFEHYGFWSAGQPGYVDEIVRALDPPRPPAFVMNFDHCDNVHREYRSRGRSADSDGRGDVSYYSELSKPLNTIFQGYPDHFTRFNTFILDDRQDYAAGNLLNWLPIKPYEPTVERLLPYDEDSLPRLMAWLQREDVVQSGNVLELNKNWWR